MHAKSFSKNLRQELRSRLFTAAVVLGSLTQQSFAYSPPLQNVEAWIETNAIATTIHYRAFDPTLNAFQESSTQYPRAGEDYWRVPNGFLSTNQGIVAWRIERVDNGDDLSDEEVGFATYDPGRGYWVHDSVYYDSFPTSGVDFWQVPSVSFFLNQDGVVAWRMEQWQPAALGGSQDRDEEVGFATYDPQGSG